MAKPIDPTPPLDAADAKALLEALDKVKVTPEEMARRAAASRRVVAKFMAPKSRARPNNDSPKR